MRRTAVQDLGMPGEAVDVGLRQAAAEVYSHLPRTRRRQLLVLLILMTITALAELASIGSVIPLLTLLADPGALSRNPWLEGIFEAVGAVGAADRLVFATLAFASFAVIAGGLRLYLAWFTQDFIYRLGHDLAVEIQSRILAQPYSFHLYKNTSTLLSAIQKTEVFVFNLLLPPMQAAIAGFLSIAIIAALIYIDPLTALIAAAAFSITYLLVSSAAQKRLRKNSDAIKTAWDERIKIVQESLGGIRDVIIDNSQAMYVRMFERVNLRLSLARANTAFVAGAPRFIIETIGVILIALLALIISRREGGLAAALPILGAAAFAAQRLLPLLQQIYAAWSNTLGNRSVLVQVLDLLRLPASVEDPGPSRANPLPLSARISLENVSFTYPSRRKTTLHEITFDISAGATVAITGETGSGKSTLADLLMGLLEPDEGRICVDGTPLTGTNRRRWQGAIAHVPQSIFLADDSIARNISLGRPHEEIDLGRVEAASRKAQLHEFIMSLPDAYDTLVGERGIRLSGGQRQRLGIARAIYKEAPVLVLDEATSALDEATEAAVMDGLYELGGEGRTIIIIAHRLSTIARADRFVRLGNGRLVELSDSASGVASAR